MHWASWDRTCSFTALAPVCSDAPRRRTAVYTEEVEYFENTSVNFCLWRSRIRYSFSRENLYFRSLKLHFTKYFQPRLTDKELARLIYNFCSLTICIFSILKTYLQNNIDKIQILVAVLWDRTHCRFAGRRSEIRSHSSKGSRFDSPYLQNLFLFSDRSSSPLVHNAIKQYSKIVLPGS